MSSTTAPSVFVPAEGDLYLGGVIRSEWIKFRSVRSTWWAYAVLLTLTVGIGAQVSSSLSFEGMPDVPTQDAIQDMAVYAVTVTTDFGALIVGALGVVVIAGEYGTGTIRSTITAVPTRLPILFAKALVFAVATFVVSAVAFAVTVPLSVSLLARNDVAVRLDDPQYWLALLGGVGYLVLVGLIAFSVGGLMRTTAGGMSVTFVLLLVAPIATSFLPTGAENVAVLLPSIAGDVLLSYPTEQSWVDLAAPTASSDWITEPWQGGLTLVAWVAVLFTAAAVLLEQRDA
ncbi:ABC transporter permease [Myceligenerans salitolerans]|uniref:ABC transporter permease subunit n=1 Tax=Myceligenerans salitolerans TaxID=1230528 RepID=A0ABS3IB49_9MICO|nr:ABC transporter permease subunit [Myceligenerans salitolerans]MBO0610255.1 ABC transporter permease subunit [Myceligenerans salitolerans]